MIEPPHRRPSAQPIDLAASLPVRAGEALFWLGRHAERAEAMLRLGRVIGEYVRVVDWRRAEARAGVAQPNGGDPCVAGCVGTDW